MYARLLGNMLGDQFAVVVSVLLTFLLSIGIGTLLAHRLWRYLWLIELSIGACGATLALGSDSLDRWFYATIPLFGQGIGGSLALAIGALSLPAFLIGCSLPLFAGYWSRLSPGRTFSRAYTLYNLGAAVTALGIEFWLLRLSGLRLAVLSIASLNLLVSGILRLRFAAIRDDPPEREAATRFPANHLVALALVSLASAIFQLVMVKLSEFVLGPFHETFALVLAIVFAGLAIGTWVTERLRLGFGVVSLIALVSLALVLATVGPIAHLYAGLYPSATESYLASVLIKLVFVVLVMGLPAAAFGATIPSLMVTEQNVARESGQLLFVSSVANAAGFLTMALFLHRALDYGPLLLLLAAVTFAAYLVYARPFPTGGGMPEGAWSRLGFATLALVFAFAFQKRLWNEELLYLGFTKFSSSERLESSLEAQRTTQRFKGYQDVFSINYIDGRPFFFVNGYISMPLDNPSEHIVGAFSSLFAPRTDKALVLGLGSGATASVVSLLFDDVDAVEINPMVVENLWRMEKWNFGIQKMPHVHISVDDALHYVKYHDKKYSLIVNTVTTPLFFSSSKLYTRDFLESVNQRLEPDGVYMTWLDARVGDGGAEIILDTLASVFKSCTLGSIKGAYHVFLCSQQPVRVYDANRIADNEILHDQFLTRYRIHPKWIAYGLLVDEALELRVDEGGVVNTLDYPALEFEMARARTREFKGFMKRVEEHATLDSQEARLSPVMKWDRVELFVHSMQYMGMSKITRHWGQQSLERGPTGDRYDEIRAWLDSEVEKARSNGKATPADSKRTPPPSRG